MAGILKRFLLIFAVSALAGSLFADEAQPESSTTAPASQGQSDTNDKTQAATATTRPKTVIAPEYYQPPPMPLPYNSRVTPDRGVGFTMIFIREDLTSSKE